MKRRFERILIIICALCMLVSLSACKYETSEKPTPQQFAWSFDKIVCRLEMTSSFGADYDRVPIIYELYADNTLKIFTGPYNSKKVSLEEVVSWEYSVTNEQRKEIEEAIIDYRIDSLGDMSSDVSAEGVWKYISLFDEQGNVISRCGGLNPRSEGFDTVEYMIRSLVGSKEIKLIKEETRDIILDKEKIVPYGVSQKAVICEVCFAPLSGYTYNHFAVKIRIDANGEYEIATTDLDLALVNGDWIAETGKISEEAAEEIAAKAAEYYYSLEPVTINEASAYNEMADKRLILSFFDKQGNMKYNYLISEVDYYNKNYYKLVELIISIIGEDKIKRIEEETLMEEMNELHHGVSYNKVICQYVYTPYNSEYELREFATKYKIYADGTVEVSTGQSNDVNDEKTFLSKTYTIDEKTVQAVAREVFTKTDWRLCVPPTDACIGYFEQMIVLYDENGIPANVNIVNGDPDGRFEELGKLITQLVPQGEIMQMENETWARIYKNGQ